MILVINYFINIFNSFLFIYLAVGNSISSGVGNVTRLVGNVGLVARSDDSDVTDDGDVNSSDERNSAAFPSPIQDEYVLETKLKIIEILHVRYSLKSKKAWLFGLRRFIVRLNG